MPLNKGSYNKIPQTGWLLSDRNLFLLVLEAGSPRTRCQQIWLWWGPTSWFLCNCPLAVSSRGRMDRDKGPLRACFHLWGLSPHHQWSSNFLHQGQFSWMTIFPQTGVAGWFQDDSSTLYLFCTLSLLLLHQFHLRSSGIRSQRLGSLAHELITTQRPHLQIPSHWG